jgi:thiol-disulfide isomerase/thioredoxin
MKKLLILTSLLFSVHTGIIAQQIPVYDSFEAFRFHLEKNNDTTYVINFWATYCAPCIKEMPVFRKLEKNYADEPLQIILTSLDFKGDVKERVRTFMKRHKIRSRVVVLDDPDSNSWIDKVSANWSGALPATLIYNKHSRQLYEKTFTYPELKNIIESKMRKP